MIMHLLLPALPSLAHLVSATGPAAPVIQARIPTTIVDAFNAAEQAFFTNNPDLAYASFGICFYLAAAGIVLQIRGALNKEWTTIGDWTDRVVVVISSTNASNYSHIECHHLGELAIVKGKMFLQWPDHTALPLALQNRTILRIAERGNSWRSWTSTLTSGYAFFTMFMIECAIAWILWLEDAPARQISNYAAQHQNWLMLIFIWPAGLFIFQHMVLQDWREALSAAEADMNKLSRQFKFSPRKIAKSKAAVSDEEATEPQA